MRRGPRNGPLFENEVVLEKKSSTSSVFDPTQWLNAVEAAIALKRFCRKDGSPSVGAIRNLVYRKKLKARNVLGRLFFSRADIEKLIQASPIVGGVSW